MEVQTKKNILVCPMDWGLGHATRCVPIIEQLIAAGANVVVGADNKPLDFLRLRFPNLPWIRLKGFQPEYQKRGSLALKVATELPKMMKIVKPVQQNLEKIIREYPIDAVVSDNRYELWSEQVPTVFMTHQLRILTTGILAPLRPAIQKVLYSFIEKHNELWIPDNEQEPYLSGDLSHVEKFPAIPSYFVGPLTRFEKLIKTAPVNKPLDVLCILSGPEPQRTLFEELLTKQLENSEFRSVILSAKPESTQVVSKGSIQILPHAQDAEIAGLINAASIVISRSGYTTLMDLTAFGKKALFVPTPGQPEQEYLAKVLMNSGHFFSIDQNRLNLPADIPKALQYEGITMNNTYQILKERIAALLERI